MMVHDSVPPSQIFREVLSSLPPDEQDRRTLVDYFREAFCFREGEAHTIFGWMSDGSDYLQDSQLDALMSKKIDQTRDEWDQ